jgi:hypothetical protein
VSTKVRDRILRFGWEISLTELSLSLWLEAYVFGQIEELPLDQNSNHSDLMNHSCDPNVWYQDDNTQVARRPIAAGEEICQDYAMDRSGPMAFQCLCGTPACRSVIRKSDFALPEIRSRYGAHVKSLIVQAWEDPGLLEALQHSYPF